MIRNYKFKLLWVLISLFTISCAARTLKGDEWVLLPGKHAKEIVSQCSRPGPEHFESTWEPTRSDIDRLEKELENLQKIKSEECCFAGSRISNVHGYFRQYIGIVVDGKKLIYINAFRRGFEGDDWRLEPLLMCDGATDFWGVLFDPRNNTFSNLSFNSGE